MFLRVIERLHSFLIKIARLVLRFYEMLDVKTNEKYIIVWGYAASIMEASAASKPVLRGVTPCNFQCYLFNYN